MIDRNYFDLISSGWNHSLQLNQAEVNELQSPQHHIISSSMTARTAAVENAKS